MQGRLANTLEPFCWPPVPRPARAIPANRFGDKLGTVLPLQTQFAYNANEGLKRFSPHEIQGLQRIIDVGATISKCRYSG